MSSQLLKTESLLSLEKQIEQNMQVKAQIIKLINESEQLEIELDALQDKIRKLATGATSLQYLVPLIEVGKVQAKKQLTLIEGKVEIMPLNAKEENILTEPERESKKVNQDPADEETQAKSL